MKAPSLGEAEGTVLLVAGAVALLAVWYVVRKGPAAVGGALSGNNALTQSATNADGTPQTAYVGAGLPGTLGAGANTITGGVLSSVGDWIGSKFYDLTQPDVNAKANDDLAARNAAAAASAGTIDYGYPSTNPYGW